MMVPSFRHASEGWHLTSSFPVTLKEQRDPSLRWDDGMVPETKA
jgi:hypothetical protein